jgi:hypothetical protein
MQTRQTRFSGALLPIALVLVAAFSASTNAQVAPPLGGVTNAPNSPVPPHRPRPDLTPTYQFPPSSPEGFPGTGACGTDGSGRPAKHVWVLLRNLGAAETGPFGYRIRFNANGQEFIGNLPNIPPGGSSVVGAQIPAAAWSNGSAWFTTTVDQNNTVMETNEANNSLTAKCLQPET